MSDVVSNRIVELEFDNSNFEHNVDKSLKTLDKLNRNLEMTGSKSGFDSLNQSIKNISFTSLIENIQKVTDKFQSLGIIGTTALVNITNKAVNAGLHLAKSLSVDQLSAGWTKYEEMIAAEQTIVAATGKEQEVVNAALDQLLWYTDETSYNFIDMANSIGKFTSNNVDLFESVDAMQGIASWAAISGQKTQQASMAMYNISQALGMGYLSVADWRSIELANMATAQFKDIAIETGKAIGTLVEYDMGGETFAIPESSIDSLDNWLSQLEHGKITEEAFYENVKSITVSTENLRNTLSEKWFTTDVIKATLTEYGKFPTLLYESMQALGEEKITTQQMLDYLEEYKDNINSTATAEEKRAKAEEIISRAHEETKISASDLRQELDKLSASELELSYKAFRAGQESKTLSDVISYTKDAVSSSWMKIYKTIFGDYEEAKKIWTPIANEAYDIFVAPVENIWEVIGNIKDSGGIDALFGGISNVYNSIKNFFSGIIGVVKAILGLDDINGVSSFFTTISEGFYNITEKLKITDGFGDKLKNIFEPIIALGNTVIDIGGKAIGFIATIGEGAATILGGALSELWSRSSGFMANVNAFLSDLFGVNEEVEVLNENLEETGLKKFLKTIRKTGTLIKDELIKKIGTFWEKVKTFDTTKFFTNFGNGLENIGKNIGIAYRSIVGELRKGLQNGGAGLKQFFNDVHDLIFNVVIPSLPEIFESIISAIPNLIKGIGAAIGEFKKSIETHKAEIQEAWKSLFTPGKKIGKDVTDAAEDAAEQVPESDGSVLKSILEKAFGIGYLGKDIIFDTILTAGLVQMPGAISGLMKSISATNEASVGLLNKLSGEVKVSAGKKAAGVIKQLGLGLLMIAVAALIFNEIPIEELWSAVGAAGAAIGAVVAFTFLMGLIQKELLGFQGLIATAKKGEGLKITKDSNPFTSMIVSLGIALLAIAGAAKIFSSIPAKKIGQVIGLMALSFGLIIGFVLALAGLTKSLSKIGDAAKIKESSKVLSRISGGLIVMAIAITLLAGSVLAVALASLAIGGIITMGGWNVLWGFLAIVGVVTAMIFVVKGIANMKVRPDEFTTGAKKFISAAFGLIVMAAAIAALSASLVILIASAALISIILSASGFWSTFGSLILMGAIITGLVFAVRAIAKSKVAAAELYKAVGILAALGGAMIILAAGIASFAVGMLAVGTACAAIKAGGGHPLGILISIIVGLIAAIELLTFLGAASSAALPGVGILALLGLSLIFVAAGIAAAGIGLAIAAVSLAVGVKLIGAIFSTMSGGEIFGGVVGVLGTAAMLIAGAALFGTAALAWIGATIGFAIAAKSFEEAVMAFLIAGNNADAVRAGAESLIGAIDYLFSTLDKYADDAKNLKKLARAFRVLVNSLGAAGVYKAVFGDNFDFIDENRNGLDDLEEDYEELANSANNAAEANYNFADSASVLKGVTGLDLNMKDVFGLMKGAMNGELDQDAAMQMFGSVLPFDATAVQNGDFGGLIDALGLNESQLSELRGYFEEAGEEIPEELSSMFATMEDSGEKFVENIEDGTKTIGETVETGIVKPLHYTRETAKKEIKRLNDEMENELDKLPALTSASTEDEQKEYWTKYQEILQKYNGLKNDINKDAAGQGKFDRNVKSTEKYLGREIGYLDAAIDSYVLASASGDSEKIDNAFMEYEDIIWKIEEYQAKLSELYSDDRFMGEKKQNLLANPEELLSGKFEALTTEYGPEKAQSYIDSLLSAITSSNVGKTVSGIVEPELSSAVGPATTSGTNAGLGFANGMAGTLPQVVSASELLARAAAAKLNSTLQVHSPSKLTYKSGVFFDLGFINAIIDKTPDAVKAASNFAKSAYDAIASNIGNISGVLAGKYQPRVAPVIDTSSYNSGLSYLTSSFNATRGTIAKTAETIEGARGSNDVTLHHEFADLTVRGVNDKNEFVDVANYSVDEILSKVMRRQYRV